VPNEKLDPAEPSPGGKPQQRRFLRATVELPVTYAVEGAEPRLGKAVNLGGGGLRLATDEDIPSGTVLRLRFALPGGRREMRMRGRIVLSFFNAVDGHFAHGIAFTQIDPDDQEEIVRFIHEHQRLEMQGRGPAG
jgi:c-di-GMP-binding flagellar brake protein YcgR